jgi:hypothetical protein
MKLRPNKSGYPKKRIQKFVLLQESSAVCRHRGQKSLEAKDIRFVLGRKFGVLAADPRTLNSNNSYAALGLPNGPPAAKRQALIAHQQRMALIDKSLKKL